MRNQSRVIAIDNKNILFIHRFRNGEEYYVLPGGGIEKGETPEEAAIREIKEEAGLDAELDSKLWEMYDKYGENHIHIFLAKRFSGKLTLGGPEKEINCEENRYIPTWTPLAKIKNLTIYPEGLKEKLIERFLK
jgi:8-oxo-dGTP diphosphatase